MPRFYITPQTPTLTTRALSRRLVRLSFGYSDKRQKIRGGKPLLKIQRNYEKTTKKQLFFACLTWIVKTVSNLPMFS